MKIGIVGIGVVGSALRSGFLKLGHEVAVHDTKFCTDIEAVLETQIVYLCLPTPTRGDGGCDTTVVESVVAQLAALEYRGIVAIKSTISPGTTKSLQQQYPQLQVACVPEFLRERVALPDFIENQDVCIIGTDDLHVYETIKNSHGTFPKKFRQVAPTEAELAKYFCNVYNAMHVTFANNFYEICQKLQADYSRLKSSIVLHKHIYDKYLDCNQNLRGFGGHCLPKDTKALVHIVKHLGIDVRLFQAILEDNEKYETTVL